jgi:protein-tyrosine phosphatase
MEFTDSFSEINDPNLILKDKLWISCLIGAAKVKYFPKISAVVSIGPDQRFVDMHYAKFANKTYHYVFVEDDQTANLLQYLDAATEFIHNHKGQVLVHCAAGISRSATVCIAYLMRFEGYTLNNALEACQKARPIVQPNEGFMEQLKLYEINLSKK